MESKKPDLRDQTKGKGSVTDEKAVMAGRGETPESVITPHSNMHELTPEIGKHLAEGQVTKSS